MKTRLFLIAAAVCLAGALAFTGCSPKITAQAGKTPGSKVVVAYAFRGNEALEGQFITHINYAFGHVSKTFDSVTIPSPERLKSLVDLRKKYPHLNIMVSIGGWGSGRFSEMVTNPEYRHKFVADCKRVVDEYGLQGIDLDWEYPTSSASGISSAPTDTDNFTLLVRELRAALGPDAFLTMASVCSAQYVDFPAVVDYFDFINIMSYDMMGDGLGFHAALYPSEHTLGWTMSTAVDAHIAAGVPVEKLVLGVPFYGRGERGNKNMEYINYKDIPFSIYDQRWDEKACSPYLVDSKGNFIFGYDDAHSLSIKCKYALDRKLRGAMYWSYDGDNAAGDLHRAVGRVILGVKK